MPWSQRELIADKITHPPTRCQPLVRLSHPHSRKSPARLAVSTLTRYGVFLILCFDTFYTSWYNNGIPAQPQRSEQGRTFSFFHRITEGGEEMEKIIAAMYYIAATMFGLLSLYEGTQVILRLLDGEMEEAIASSIMAVLFSTAMRLSLQRAASRPGDD